MDRDSSALQPVSISLATNDSSCCTTTNGLCPPLLSYLPLLTLSLSPSFLSISYHSMPCYLSTSPLHLYLIFIMLRSFSFYALSLPNSSSLSQCVSLSFLSCSASPLYFHLFNTISILPTTMTKKKPQKFTLSSLCLIFLCTAWMGKKRRNNRAVSIFFLSFLALNYFLQSLSVMCAELKTIL